MRHVGGNEDKYKHNHRHMRSWHLGVSAAQSVLYMAQSIYALCGVLVALCGFARRRAVPGVRLAREAHLSGHYETRLPRKLDR